MDVDQAKPRINASMIPKYIGSYVTVVGRTQGSSTSSSSMQIETGDKQLLTVNFQQQLTEPLSQFVELIGRVESDCTLTVLRHVNFGDNFDLDIYNQVTQIMPNFPTIFPNTSSSVM